LGVRGAVAHALFKGLTNMWPFQPKPRKAVVVFHVDQNGLARGAYFRGDADVLVIDERDPKNRVYRMTQETGDDELRRRIGKHPLGRLLETKEVDAKQSPVPVLNLHWRHNDTHAVI
jgi:hypothetical protein